MLHSAISKEINAGHEAKRHRTKFAKEPNLTDATQSDLLKFAT